MPDDDDDDADEDNEVDEDGDDVERTNEDEDEKAGVQSLWERAWMEGGSDADDNCDDDEEISLTWRWWTVDDAAAANDRVDDDSDAGAKIQTPDLLVPHSTCECTTHSACTLLCGSTADGEVCTEADDGEEQNNCEDWCCSKILNSEGKVGVNKNNSMDSRLMSADKFEDVNVAVAVEEFNADDCEDGE